MLEVLTELEFKDLLHQEQFLKTSLFNQQLLVKLNG
jgi:hypothetical protein